MLVLQRTHQKIMPVEECLDVFRDEVREHLPWEEAQTYLGLFETRQNWTIYQEMELLKKQAVSLHSASRMLWTFFMNYTRADPTDSESMPKAP